MTIYNGAVCDLRAHTSTDAASAARLNSDPVNADVRDVCNNASAEEVHYTTVADINVVRGRVRHEDAGYATKAADRVPVEIEGHTAGRDLDGALGINEGNVAGEVI